jgi:hypothetical protein
MPVLEPGSGGIAGRYDAVACVAWWRIRRPGTLDAEKARHLKSQADQGELRLAERKGQLVHRDQAIREGQSVAKAIRGRLLALPRRLVQLGLMRPDQEGAVRALVLEMLAEMATWSVTQIDGLAAAAEGA